MNSRVEHGAKRFHRRWFYSAKTFGECVGPENRDGARFRFAERFADPATMRADKVHLQLANLFGGNAHAGQFAESRVDTVSGLAGGDEFVYHSAGGIHLLAGNSSEQMDASRAVVDK